MRIAVLGPGALGCLLAASLFEAGEDVFLVDYRPERTELLRRRCIIVQWLDGRRCTLPVPIGLPMEAGERDLAIMAVKAHQSGAAARSLPQLLAADGIALTIQNGLGNLEAMAQEIGPERLLAGVGFLGATREDEGCVIYTGAGTLVIGAPPGSLVPPVRLNAVAETFRRAGFACQVRDDIETVLWEKLVINVAINPLTALLRVHNGVLLELTEAWELAVGAAREAQAVARAAGLDLTGDFEAHLRQVCTATAANRSSMLQDVLAGRPTEIEALNAQVVAQGAALGVPTPINRVLTQLLRALGTSAARRVG